MITIRWSRKKDCSSGGPSFIDYDSIPLLSLVPLHIVLVSGVLLAETRSYLYFWFLVRLYYRVFAGYYTTMYESRQNAVNDEHDEACIGTQIGKLFPADCV